jgi:type I restriction enzyme S subunit
MSRIEELIQQLCPQGVEQKTIQDVCKNIVSGGTPLTSRTEYYNGNIPWLRTQEVDWTDIDYTGIKITEAGLKNSSAKLIPENCVIVAMYGATAAKVAVNKIPLCTNQACCNLEIDDAVASYRYVYYWLCNNYNHLRSLGEGSQSNINGQKIKSYPIPVPPLEVQEEIVKNLDLFTKLEAELEAELEARKTQYNYYRDALLSFEGKEVEWKTLGEVYEFKNGLNKGKEFFGQGTPIVNFKDVFKNRSLSKADLVGKVEVSAKEKILYSAQKDDLFFTRTSETQDDIGMCCALLDDIEDCVFSGFVLRARPKTNLFLPKFCSYFLTSNCARKEIVRNSTYTTRALTSGSRLAKIKIPIPSLSEQEKIVNILDQLHALVNDISTGLPAEIQARRKQYEYYRNRLLTFKELANG